MSTQQNEDVCEPEVSDPERLEDDEFDRDDRLVDWLALGYSHERAGAEVGLSARSVKRRLNQREFKARVSLRGRELHAESWEATFSLRDKAVARLERLLDSEDERVAISAIRLAFDISVRVRAEQAHQDLTDQVDELSAQVDRVADELQIPERELKKREASVSKREVDVAELERGSVGSQRSTPRSTEDSP